MSKNIKDIEGITPEELRDYKDKIIGEVYYDEDHGYKNKFQTYKLAHEKSAIITRHDVNDWFERNGESLKPRSFKNSYIAQYPTWEYQMDLFQLNKTSGIKDFNKLCLIMVDIFTKRTEIVPIQGKNAKDLQTGIEKLIEKMGREPLMIYTDQEPALKNQKITKYMKDKNIHLIMTLTHAAVVERQIRTFKRMIIERLRKRPEAERIYHNEAFLDRLTSIYNHEVHHTTGMTPIEAEKKENERAVRTQLELHRLPMHYYPRLEVGDQVKKLLKKQTFDKESDPRWSKRSYKISKIEEISGQSFYKLSNDDPSSKPEYMQHELLLVKKGSTT